MHGRQRGPWLVCVLVAAVTIAACGGGGGDAAQEAARDAEWRWLQETKQTLDAKRAELQQVREQLEGGGEVADPETAGEAEPGTGAAVASDDLAARAQALEDEIADLAEEFNERLVIFINANPIIEGQPPTELQVAAIRMKSEEDMAIAVEYIEKGGDYRRAIDIYEAALMVDPENPELQAALEEARSRRFMSEERFSQVKKGMTQEQVRGLLGTVNPRNVRDYPEREVEAWFYPKGGGGAAAVFFQKERRGDTMVVYQLDFDALDTETGAD